MRYDFGRLGNDRFQKMVQALFVAETGGAARLTGSGPDGGCEATFTGPLALAASGGGDGRTCLQAKYKETLSDRPATNAKWLLERVRKDLEGFSGREDGKNLPDNYILATNVVLTGMANGGSWQKLDDLIEEFRPNFPEGKFATLWVWDQNHLQARLDAHPKIAGAYFDDLAPGALVKSATEMTAVLAAVLAMSREAIGERLIAEGKKRPREWFENWPANGALPAAAAPPVVGFGTDTYVERDIESDIVTCLRKGVAAGITGLVGMGGIGKTHMALKIATDFHAEGWDVAWIGLLKIDHGQALDAFAEVFGLRFLAGLAVEEKEAALAELIDGHRRAQTRLLVVLDNAEHFGGLESLLKVCLGIPVLVTSRTREADGIVSYRDLSQMDEAQAASLCRSFLGKRRPGFYDRDLGKAERTELAALCSDLGGHPLGIRLALSGIWPELRKPLRGPTVLADFRAKLQRQPISLLCSSEEDQRGGCADELHRSVQRTFDWLFQDLPVRAPETGREAQLLLPLVGQLAVVPLAVDKLGASVEALIEVVTKDPDAPKGTEWMDALARLKDPDRRFQALETLYELSLITLVAQQGQEIQVHPLVREYAFHDRRQARESLGDAAGAMVTASGPSDLAILTAVIRGSRELASRGDILMGLRARQLDARLMREAAQAAFDQAEEYYYLERRLEKAEDLYSAFLPLAEEAGDAYFAGQLLCDRGELRLRMENPEGLEDVRKGTALLAGLDERKARKSAAWGRHLLREYSDPPASPEEAQAAFEAFRDLLGDPEFVSSHAAVDGTLGDVAPWLDDGVVSLLYDDTALRSPFLSNLVWQLTDLCADARARPADIERVEALLKKVIDCRDNPSGRRADARVSQDAELAVGHNILVRQAEWGTLSNDAAKRAFDTLADAVRKAGMRGFAIEAARRDALWRQAIGRRDWPAAEREAGKWLESALRINSHAPYRKSGKARVCHLLSRALAVDPADLPAVAEGIAALEADTRRFADNGKAGWIQLARAVIAARRGDPPRTTAVLALQARRAFMRAGCVPLAAERVFRAVVDLVDDALPRFEALRDDLSARPDETNPPDYQPWNLGRVRPLPDRVASSRDGRVMRLVEGGWQPGPWIGPDRARDIYIHSFYIDERPLTAGDLRRLGRTDLIPAGHPEDGDPVRLPFEAAAEFAASLGKRLPIGAEWTAMVWQHQAGGRPQAWTDWAEAADAVFERIERAIDGDVSPQLHWPSQTASLNLPKADSVSADPDWEAALAYWWGEGWIRDLPEVSDLLSGQVLPALRAKAGDVPEDRLGALAEALVNSVSLGAGEMARLLRPEPTLTGAQVERMLAVLAEERGRFAESPPPERRGAWIMIASRCLRFRGLGEGRFLRQSGSISIKRAIAAWQSPVGFWIDRVRNQPDRTFAGARPVFDGGIGFALPQPPTFQDRRGEAALYVRFVLPLFAATDLDGLAPIEGDGLGAQDSPSRSKGA